MQDIELILIAAGALLLIVSALLGKRKEAESPPPPVPAPGVSPEGAVELRASLSELLRDLQELNDDMTADLEDKLAELKEVLEEADNKLEEMSAAGIGQDPPEEFSQEFSQEPSGETESPASGAAIPEPRWPSESAESQSSRESNESREPLEREENIPMPPPTGRYGEIYRLEDGGLPVEEIARRMNMGKGEIQLILSLREKD